MADDDKPKRPARKRAATRPPTAPAAPVEPVTADPDSPPDGDVTSAPEASSSSVVVSSALPDADVDDVIVTESAAFNHLVMGTLKVAYPERDVTLVLDGHTASKVMAVFAGTGRRRRLEDTLVVGVSSMRNAWATIKLDRVLAMDWFPGLPSETTMTVDPPVESD